MLYRINNDDFIYDDSYIEDYNNDEYYKIIVYSHLSVNLLFIQTQEIDKNKNIASIKSELNNDRKKAIIWWNLEGDNQTRYCNYSLYYLTNLYSSKMPNACINSKNEPRITLFN